MGFNSNLTLEGEGFLESEQEDLFPVPSEDPNNPFPMSRKDQEENFNPHDPSWGEEMDLD